MEQTDRIILQKVLAQRVGKVVSDVIGKEEGLNEDIEIDVYVETPSCYYDDTGERHTGRLITVNVDFIDETDEEDM